MKRTHLAIAIVGVSVLLAAETPICRRILIPVIHRHHSKATLAKWAEWNKTHVPPTPKQILAEIDLVCAAIPTQHLDLDTFVLPVDAPVWVEPSVEPHPAKLSAPGYVIPERTVLAVQSIYSLPGGPFPVAYQPPTVAPVPEPSAIYLMLTGIIALCLTAFAKHAEVRV
jgi:hypothetical protein